MSRQTALARGSVAAELGMADTCTIRRRLSEVTDPNTAVVTPTYQVLYQGKCRVQQQATMSRPQNAGQDLLWMLRLDVQLPMSVTGLQVDDEVVITAAINDADLIGRTFYIRELAHKSEATARRVGVVERTS